MDPLNSIELILKTPNQRIDDIQLKCNEEWTVKMLKDHLQNVYPSKPESSSQRLIYLGKLLQDHVILKEVFTGLGVKTLHIVCSDLSGQTNSASVSNSAPVSSTQSSSTTSSDTTDGLRYRGLSTPNPNSSSTYPLQSAGMPNGQNNTMNQQQYQQLWNQQYQMQLQQYYMHMQQWQQAMATGQIPYYSSIQGGVNPLGVPRTPPATPNTPSTPGTPGPIPQNEEPQPQPVINNNLNQQQQQPRNQNMNAGPGGGMMAPADDEDENGGNRDWLDVLYMSLRALMLLSIVYFYSSTTRFAMVAILGFIVYLYQGGWFTPRRVQPAPAPEPVQARPAQENNDEVDNGINNMNREPNSTNDPNNDTSEGEQNSTSPPEPPRPGAFRVFCTFVTSFVTSLIPTAPPPLQQN